MATSTDEISYMQHRTTLSAETHLIPIHLNESELSLFVRNFASQIVATFSSKSPILQRGNYRFLIQMIEILARLLESITEAGSHQPSLLTCLTESVVLLNRAKELLKYCLKSCRLSLLISNFTISNYFYDLDQDILCILDVINWKDVNLSDDVGDRVRFLRKHLGQEKIFVDHMAESLKRTIFGFHKELEAGEVPDYKNVYKFFVKDLGINDIESWNIERESLEQMIEKHENDCCVPIPVLRGFAALMEYSKLLIFCGQEEFPPVLGFFAAIVELEINENEENQLDAITSSIIPNEFKCPITQDRMLDPVILTTGHTFERTAILEWFKRGNLSCPITRTELSSTNLIPNKVLQSMISKWCAAYGIPNNFPARPKTPLKRRRNILENSTRAVWVAKKATLKLIVDLILQGVKRAQCLAMEQLQQLAAGDKQMCIEIVNSGLVPSLVELLESKDPKIQENSAVTIMHVSLYNENKESIMQTKGSVAKLLQVFWEGAYIGSQHALATIRNLSMVSKYKKKIARERGLLRAMSLVFYEKGMMNMINAMQIIRNLSLKEMRIHMIRAGIVGAMVEAIEFPEFRTLAAYVLAGLVTLRKGAKQCRKEKMLVTTMTFMMQWGNSLEKETAAQALLAFYRFGGSKAMTKSYKQPQLRVLIIQLLQSHLPRDRNTAAQLLRLHESLHEFM